MIPEAVAILQDVLRERFPAYTAEETIARAAWQAYNALIEAGYAL